MRAGAVAVLATLVIGAPTGAGAAKSDKQIAQSGVIQATDLPTTWSASAKPSPEDPALLKAARKITACKTYLKARSRLDATTKAGSVDFSLGEDEINNQVRVFPRLAEAKQTFALMTDASIEQCFVELFEQVFGDDLDDEPTVRDFQVEVDQVGLSDVPDLADLGDDASILAAAVGVAFTTGPNQTVPLLTIIVRADRAISSYTLTGGLTVSGQISDPTYAAFEAAVQAAAGRLQRSLG